MIRHEKKNCANRRYSELTHAERISRLTILAIELGYDYEFIEPSHLHEQNIEAICPSVWGELPESEWPYRILMDKTRANLAGANFNSAPTAATKPSLIFHATKNDQSIDLCVDHCAAVIYRLLPGHPDFDQDLKMYAGEPNAS